MCRQHEQAADIVDANSSGIGTTAFELLAMQRDQLVCLIECTTKAISDDRGVDQRLVLQQGLRRQLFDIAFDQAKAFLRDQRDRKSTRLNTSHYCAYRMPSSA